MLMMLRENLVAALDLAIRRQRSCERLNLHYDRDSALVAGWVDIKEALEKGEDVTISPRGRYSDQVQSSLLKIVNRADD